MHINQHASGYSESNAIHTRAKPRNTRNYIAQIKTAPCLAHIREFSIISIATRRESIAAAMGAMDAAVAVTRRDSTLQISAVYFRSIMELFIVFKFASVNALHCISYKCMLHVCVCMRGKHKQIAIEIIIKQYFLRLK